MTAAPACSNASLSTPVKESSKETASKAEAPAQPITPTSGQKGTSRKSISGSLKVKSPLTKKQTPKLSKVVAASKSSPRSKSKTVSMTSPAASTAAGVLPTSTGKESVGVLGSLYSRIMEALGFL